MDKYLLLCILIIIIIICGFYLYKNNISLKEKFETYSYEGSGFSFMDSGASPLTFYFYPAYRKPYMFPQVFYSSYPYPYLQNYEMNI
jgi:hypothetical protein